MTNRGVPIGWDHVDPDAAYAGLVRAHELGVTLYDTADVYGLGHSERLLGRLLRTIDRSSVVVSSKVGYFAGTACHPAQMRRQFATILDNLGTSHLDIYSLHSSDFGDNDHYPPVQYIEVEKKFALPDPAALKAQLDELGANPANRPARSMPTTTLRIVTSSHPRRSRSGCASAPRNAARRSTSSAGTRSTP